MRFLTVTQEQFNASLEGYKGLLEFKYRKTFGGYEEFLSPRLPSTANRLYLSLFEAPTASRSATGSILVAIIPSEPLLRASPRGAPNRFSTRLNQPSKNIVSFHYTEQAAARASR